LVRGEVAALPLKGVIDLSAEKARLEKELAKAEADIKRVDAKLSNGKFVANAPEEIVEEEQDKRDAAGARKAKILEALELLKKAAYSCVVCFRAPPAVAIPWLQASIPCCGASPW
jgi:valyl-tRNA synthetase